MEEIRAKIVGLLVTTQRNIVSTLTASQSSLVRVIIQNLIVNNHNKGVKLWPIYKKLLKIFQH